MILLLLLLLLILFNDSSPFCLIRLYHFTQSRALDNRTTTTNHYYRCHHKSGPPIETALNLMVPVKAVTGKFYSSLGASLKELFVVEERETECDSPTCKGERRKKDCSLAMHRLPPLLWVSLGRHEYDWNTQTRKKLNDHFEFPLLLDLAPHVPRDAASKWTTSGEKEDSAKSDSGKEGKDAGGASGVESSCSAMDEEGEGAAEGDDASASCDRSVRIADAWAGVQCDVLAKIKEERLRLQLEAATAAD